MAVNGIESAKILRFFGTGKPMRPSPPQGIDKSGSRKGIIFSGKSSKGELTQKINASYTLSPKELGDGAVKLSKSMGLNVNTTI